jgi:uncharacterized protein (DUF1501 family)
MGLNRRDFFKASLLGAGAMALHPRLVFGAGAGAGDRDVLVCVFQRGGMDGLNAVVPYADPGYRSLRPTIGLPEPGSATGATLDLDGFFALNPAAASLKLLYDAGELAIVHACGGLHGDFSHFTAQSLMERGVLQHVPEYSGWLNRHLEIIGSTVPFQAVGMGTAIAPSLRGDAPVIGMGSLASVALDTRSTRAAAAPELLKFLYLGNDDVDRAAQQAFDAIQVLDVADPAQYAVENGAIYPDSPFGRQLREVAQLIKAGVGLEVACIDIGGWDHHNQLNAELTPLLQQFSDALAAFRKDLGVRMADVSLVAMTEFGRRAYENGSAGTDHGVGGVMFALGGGVVGGKVYADWPGLQAADLLDGNLSITTDYRSVLAEWLRKRAGDAESTAVFPEFVDPGELGIFRPR